MLEYSKKFYNNFLEKINNTLWTYNNTSITTFTLLKFFALIFLTVWAARLILKTLDAKAEKAEVFQRPKIYRLARLTYYIALTLGFFIALSAIGFDFTSFIWIASALGVGLGFGLQPIFNNFLSGIILLFESELKIGDFIELESGIKGEIKEINFRTTTLYTQDDVRMLVPNSAVINAKVGITWTPFNPYRCIRIPFSLPVKEKNDVLLQTIIQESNKIPVTSKKKPPKIYTVKLSESSQEYELWVWVHEKVHSSGMELFSDYLNIIAETIKRTGQ